MKKRLKKRKRFCEERKIIQKQNKQIKMEKAKTKSKSSEPVAKKKK